MDNVTKFDKTKYKTQYAKQHYKRISIDMKPDTADYITEAAKAMGVSRAELLTKAALYFIDNGIDIDDVE
ncbi:MAG: ribbon-helix-helix domain-containing protein [Lachnospiraceae bacterium]|nr:ribbon-helix-helix domain-containing protein [Lachnospiraceae bacterium]MCM1233878.1 ribbon-helix-helix domain-containing protein [Ruminococcus flavefaciens]